ncbi:gliding motility-associated C-terminal domain-containing protein [Pedobacter sandarakinus]|uniref:gliding motility-associated C-terminal domain-containing protein n=1 Tax=Pedobacter sandarakinus TaxID=353156 RepID=UPI00224501BB|nr:gliding motility-associated C-terminal domain-containing protein [Pedobacter sandarakinus]MCX2576159.1 gliding motility-associated C-terminal domain-containing protein [Pedobacter sandarakinus]
MRKIQFLFLCALLVFAARETKAQTLPSTLNAASNYGNINNQLYDFSIGEMILVQTFQSPNVVLTQGFLQPFLMVQNTTDVTIVNNILTPNADGKNDFFVVKGLENHPKNKLTIFDRGGRTLFITENYQNNWDGYFNGNPLIEDTYYYMLDLGVDGTVKGFISVLHKK